jgi:hypothetical protein
MDANYRDATQSLIVIIIRCHTILDRKNSDRTTSCSAKWTGVSPGGRSIDHENLSLRAMRSEFN